MKQKWQKKWQKSGRHVTTRFDHVKKSQKSQKNRLFDMKKTEKTEKNDFRWWFEKIEFPRFFQKFPKIPKMNSFGPPKITPFLTTFWPLFDHFIPTFCPFSIPKNWKTKKQGSKKWVKKWHPTGQNARPPTHAKVAQNVKNDHFLATFWPLFGPLFDHLFKAYVTSGEKCTLWTINKRAKLNKPKEGVQKVTKTGGVQKCQTLAISGCPFLSKKVLKKC